MSSSHLGFVKSTDVVVDVLTLKEDAEDVLLLIPAARIRRTDSVVRAHVGCWWRERTVLPRNVRRVHLSRT